MKDHVKKLSEVLKFAQSLVRDFNKLKTENSPIKQILINKLNVLKIENLELKKIMLTRGSRDIFSDKTMFCTKNILRMITKETKFKSKGRLMRVVRSINS